MSSVETGRMSSVDAGQMSAAETDQMSAAETGQMSAVESRQMLCVKEGQRPAALANICLASVLSQQQTSVLSQQQTSPLLPHRHLSCQAQIATGGGNYSTKEVCSTGHWHVLLLQKWHLICTKQSMAHGIIHLPDTYPTQDLAAATQRR